MFRFPRLTGGSVLFAVAALCLASAAPVLSMGYSLIGEGDWPQDIRNRIVAAMDEAVATYNAHGRFDTWIYVQCHPDVPTAEATVCRTSGNITALEIQPNPAGGMQTGTVLPTATSFLLKATRRNCPRLATGARAMRTEPMQEMDRRISR